MTRLPGAIIGLPLRSKILLPPFPRVRLITLEFFSCPHRHLRVAFPLLNPLPCSRRASIGCGALYCPNLSKGKIHRRPSLQLLRAARMFLEAAPAGGCSHSLYLLAKAFNWSLFSASSASFAHEAANSS